MGALRGGNVGLEPDGIGTSIGYRVDVGMRHSQGAVVGLSDFADDQATSGPGRPGSEMLGQVYHNGYRSNFLPRRTQRSRFGRLGNTQPPRLLCRCVS